LEFLGVNQKGEICVKAPSLFRYYLNNPDATEKAFVDGYFRTGDIGYFDTNGFVYVVDRLKEIFKYYNNHVSMLNCVVSEPGNKRKKCLS